jgi:uncharacterized protein (DUF1697 family)
VAQRTGIETDFFVRTVRELDAILAANPFPREAATDPSHLVVTFLKKAPTRVQVASLQQAIVGREVIKAYGKQVYIVYPDGIGRSRLTATIIEKHLGSAATGRNWNTMRRLAQLAKASPMEADREPHVRRIGGP